MSTLAALHKAIVPPRYGAMGCAPLLYLTPLPLAGVDTATSAADLQSGAMAPAHSLGDGAFSGAWLIYLWS